MTPQSAPTPTRAGKTVQEYIDETPVWADATPVHYSPITRMQWLIWWLAAAGKFFEGVVVFMTGVALPLMSKEFDLGAMENGVIAAASLFGILIGATARAASRIDMAASRCSSSRWRSSSHSSCC